MNNFTIVEDLSAIILDADFNAKGKLYNTKSPSNLVYWGEASEELKQNPKTFWTTIHIEGHPIKYTYRKYTQEEKELIKAKQKDHLEAMFDYILNKYDIDSAIAFAQSEGWSEKIKQHNIDFSDRINKIKYCDNNNGQCSLFCNYFKGGCCNCGQ